ncbi:heme ABC exporter ATP-binding protein CcmA [Sphingobium sufflavum]|uniref:heme ABC exporter ATP-binding protein CcmA n=1 Tax=Sphingobium sufflavum TaxID=1129547 RepID=UPI001F3BD01D|nr:heme ABC exporter ATP-binding protein CcmA [Sphingobium sufflavum]
MDATGQATDGGPTGFPAARIDLRAVACRRGGRVLFAGLDLTLSSGQSALVGGPNGIGKSSLLRMICGLLPVFAGSVAVAGALALADERMALDMDQPLARALSFWAGIDGHGAGGTGVADALAAMALAPLADVPVHMLSTGQRKRAVLARVIASGAPVWLLDEPANGLDTASLALLDRAMGRHLQQGGIILAASHQGLPLRETVALTLSRPVAGPDDLPDDGGEGEA